MDKQRYDFIIGMQAGELKTEVAKAKGDLKKLSQAFKDTIDVLNTAPRGIGVTKELNAARDSAAKLLAEIKKLQAAGKVNLTDRGVTPKQRANIVGGVQETATKITAARPSVIETKAIREQQQALSQMQNKAITLRYALYDVGSAAQQASQALLGFSSAAVMAASAQEAAFSQIEKTLVGQASTEELESLKNELISLSTQIPVSFQELSKIGMLGSQLGIASDDIANFTEVTAKFSAITGMSVEETAMNFGKIANILGLSANQYQALGSAIAAVGVDTAATEQQIMSTAGQIGAVAKAAGFSASEVIGLSAAFASLKIAPEEARGVVVRTFNEIDRAVQGFSKNSGIGGEKLRVLADIADTTSADFAKQWGDKTSGGASYIFKKFIEGLSTRNVSQELKRLSLDGVRTSKGLSALAGGFDLVIKSMEISRQAGIAGTFLDESFATIVEDFASKLTMLKNSFDNLMAAAGGGPILDALGSIVEMITKANDALTKMIQDGGIIGSFAGFVVVITGVVGALAALAAGLAIAGGGFLALRTAYLAAAASGATFQGGLVGLIMSFGQLLGLAPATAAGVAGVGVAAKGASVGVAALTTQMKLARLALIGTGVGVALILLGELAAMFMGTGDSAEQAVTGLDEVQQGLKEVRDAANATTQELVDFINQALLPIANIVKVENALFSFGQTLRDGAKDFSQYSKAGRANITSLMATIDAFAVAAQGDQQVLANNLTALMNYMIQAGLGTAAAFEIIQAAILETGKTAETVLLPFASLEAGMQEVKTSAGGAAKEVDKLAEAFERLEARINLEESLDSFGESLTENGKKINDFSKGGRANFDALKDVIFSLRDRLSNKPQSLANAFASLKVAMMQMGITSKFAFKMVDIAMETTGKKGKALRKIIDGLFNTISESAAQSAEESKPLRTITDYVNDLSSVLDDAFNNRYANQESGDSIASAWIAIAESAEAAKKSIDEANASINEMQADKSVLEYQLQVAIRYGDTLRAESIKAKLAKLNQQLADKQEDLADAQAEANKTLVGNSKYAIENRSKIRGLVQGYNEYLTSLAATGMSSEDLNAEAAKLAEEFLNQGESMGFARDELLVYTDAFKRDFTTVIDNLPKDVTLNVVTDPALQAVIDFVKDTNAELAKILSGTIDINVPGVTGPVPLPSNGPGNNNNNSNNNNSNNNSNNNNNNSNNAGTNPRAEALALVEQRRAALKVLQDKVAEQEALMAKTREDIKAAKLDVTFAKPAAKPAKQLIVDTLERLLATQTTKRNSFYPKIEKAVKALEAAQAAVPANANSGGTGFQYRKDGGSINGPGTGTSDSIPAMLSNGEYVIRASSVSKFGKGFLDSINSGQLPGYKLGGMIIPDKGGTVKNKTMKPPKDIMKAIASDKKNTSNVLTAKQQAALLADKKGITKNTLTQLAVKKNIAEKAKIFTDMFKAFVFDASSPEMAALSAVPFGIGKGLKVAGAALAPIGKQLSSFINFKRNPSEKVLSNKDDIATMDGYVRNAAHTLFGSYAQGRAQIDNIIKSNNFGIRKGSPLVRVANESDTEILKLLKPGQAVTLDRFMSVTTASSKEFIEGMARGTVQTGGRRGGPNAPLYPIYKFNVKSDIPGIEDINKILPTPASNVSDGLLARGQNMKLRKITTDKKTGQQTYHFDLGSGIKAKTGFEQLGAKKYNQDMIAGLIREGRPDLVSVYRQNTPGLGGFQNSSEWMPRYFKDGGFSNGTDTIPAMLSPGEFVIKANAAKYYGADFMNSLNQMQVQSAGASTGSNVVYLSPDDRALLRAAIDRPISLYTENTRIAESANTGNVILAQRGMK